MGQLMIISEVVRMTEMVVLIKPGQILPVILLANENQYNTTLVELEQSETKLKNIKNENQWQTKPMVNKKNRTSSSS